MLRLNKSTGMPRGGMASVPGSILVIGASLASVVLASFGMTTQSGTDPRTDTTVMAVLRSTAHPFSDDLTAALSAARQAPDDPVLATAAARLLIDEGRARADSRLVGGALGLLRPFLEADKPEILYLAATARQYQHDFDAAVALLDRAADIAPDDVNIMLTRATLEIVQGRLRTAFSQCSTLGQRRPDVGFLCQATALMPTAQAPQVQTRLEQILAQPGLLDPSLQGWARGLLAEIAAFRGDDVMASAQFEQMLAKNPDSLRERLLLADLLLRSGEASKVKSLLATAPDSDGVLIRRVRAARDLGSDDAAAAEQLAAMVRRNAELGLDAHAREDAMFYLYVAEDPAAALERALVNWELQHEIEDAQLLFDAAEAAGRPEAARKVLDWMKAEEIVVPTLRIPLALDEAGQ